MQFSKITCCVAVDLVLIIAACRVAAGQYNAVPRIEVDATQIVIHHDSDAPPRRLVEFAAWQSSDQVEEPTWREVLPDADGSKVADRVIRLPRFVATADGTRDRLYSRWAIAHNGDTVTPTYANAIRPVRSPVRPPLRNRKGLGGFDVRRGHVEDLDELDIATVTVNVMLNFIHYEAAPGRSEFEHGERTYYVDQATIEELDRTLQAAIQRQIIVFAILLVAPPTAADKASVDMAHPDFDPAGTFPMPNVTTEAGVEIYTAALAYLAERYSHPDNRHGRIHHWIAHNEVDAGWVWTNAGKKSLAEYVELYYRSLRLIDLTAKQYDPQAKVFASLTHAWTVKEQPQFFPSRDVLDELVKLSSSEGDFDWGIAFHPYPQSLGVPETWDDSEATPDDNTPFVTFKNLEVLTRWAERPENRFRGETDRDIYLTEQGFHSRDYSERELRIQAQAFAYSWKQLADKPQILGMHYHNWYDNRGEGGLRIGLRKFPDDESDPGGAKPIWNLYRALGTTDEAAALKKFESLSASRK